MGVEYFFDTYALISLVKGMPNYAKYTENRVTTTILNLIEFYFIILRDFGDKKAKELYDNFEECVVEVPKEVIFEAMKFRLANKKQRLSYVDCIGYYLAKKNKLRFLTGDKEFEKLSNVEFVK